MGIMERNFQYLSIWQEYLRSVQNKTRDLLKSQQYCTKTPHYFLMMNEHRPQGVTIMSNGENATIRGVVYCHNSWTCPVCVPVIMSIHRTRIDKIIKQQSAKGNVAIMITQTIPHHKGLRAKQVLDELQKVYRMFTHSYYYRNISKELQIAGTIKSTECTYTKNGFHFHNHVLVFIPREKLQLALELEESVRLRYQEYFCKYTAHFTDSVPADVFTEDNNGWYLSKNKNNEVVITVGGEYVTWDCSDEMTQNHKKTVNIESRGMFELLGGDDKDKALFLEYALATKNRKRMAYSRSLHVKEVDEQEIEDALQDNIATVKVKEKAKKKLSAIAYFLPDQWTELIFYENRTGTRIRLGILQAAINGGYESIRKYLLELGLPLPYHDREEAEKLKDMVVDIGLVS